jgi:hypothetical protein
MRPTALSDLVLTLTLLGLGLGPASTRAGAAEPDLKGLWKLVILQPLTEGDLLVVAINNPGGKLEAEVRDSQPLPVLPQVRRIESKDGTVSATIRIGNDELVFTGKSSAEGTVKGMLQVGGQRVPARLERTASERISPPPQQPSPLIRDFITARNEQSAKVRVGRFREMLATKPGSPTLAPVYAELLRDSEATGRTEADVRKTVAEWVDGAKAHGDDYAREVRTLALRALGAKAAYAKLAFELASDTDATLAPDAPLQTRADVARALAKTAKLVGNEAVASKAREKSDRLEAELDEQYHKSVPPFKLVPSAGPKERKSDRVVLLELFTGAECPPCVAVDVAFDALGGSYKPTELVALQYHLHVPGPDPLTNADSQTRAEYYPDLGGTPATYFDGKSLVPGGGPMARSKVKYDEFRKVVDEALSKPGGASIDLKVDRKGDTVTIQAGAEAKAGGPKLKLRLALVEEQVRYTGGNGLRFHHQVVRSMPGGVDGKPLTDGKVKTELTVDLAQVRKGLEQYLADFSKEGISFTGDLPAIPLSKLSVVAFVQDDDDRSVLNAAIAPLGGD